MDLSLCPSFNSYSNSSQLANDAVSSASRERQTHEDDFEFEFEFASIPDLESLGDGEIRRALPVFNRDLLSDLRREPAEEEEPILVPLRKLFLDDDGDRDRDRDPPSSSSSEADELESVAEGTYCVWTPKPAASPSRCEKSSSTGSSSTAKQSRRWRIRDLLRRSNSEGGKDSAMVFIGKDKAEKLGAKSKQPKISAAAGEKKAVSAHEKFYVRNRKLKEEDKRRSYLPYRQGLVGLFAHSNGNGMGTARTFPPF